MECDSIWQCSSVLKLTQLSDIHTDEWNISINQTDNVSNKAKTITDTCQSNNADLTEGNKGN